MTNKNKIIVFSMYLASLFLSFIGFISPYIYAFLDGWNFERGNRFSNAFTLSMFLGFLILFGCFAISSVVAYENKLFHNGKTNDKN